MIHFTLGSNDFAKDLGVLLVGKATSFKKNTLEIIFSLLCFLKNPAKVKDSVGVTIRNPVHFSTWK